MTNSSHDVSTADRIALGLGWFSLGLGLAELAAPRQMARLIGVPASDRHATILRAMGAREFATGIGLLTHSNRAAGMWARVAGDALDLSLLGAAMSSPDGQRDRTLAATAAVGGVTLADWWCARALGNTHRSAAGPELAQVEAVVTIRRPIEEVYTFWRNFENFPMFMQHLESVTILDARRSHWQAKAPAGMTVTWDAEIVQERENESISWRATETSGLFNYGSVRFEHAPGGRGTEVKVRLEYEPPAGTLGRTVAKLFGREPGQQVRDDLRRFKQLLETGEIPLSDGPGLWRAAQPPASATELKTRLGVHS